MTIHLDTDVPSDPPNYFLARRVPSPEKDEKDKERDDQRKRDRDRKERKDDSGRVVRGDIPEINFVKSQIRVLSTEWKWK